MYVFQDGEGGGADEEDEEEEAANKSPCGEDGNLLPKCEVLHVAVVCAGVDASRSVVTLAKSILFYRKHPLHFHFVVDPIAKLILERLFQTWKLPQCKLYL